MNLLIPTKKSHYTFIQHISFNILLVYHGFLPLSNDLDASECGFFTIQHEMKEVYQPSLFQLTIFLGYYFDFLTVVLRMTPFTFCLLDRICHHNDCRLLSL